MVMEASLTGPLVAGDAKSVNAVVVEDTLYYRWRRWEFRDARWPRTIDVREDVLGGLVVVARVQNLAEKDGFAPDLGWVLRSGLEPGFVRLGDREFEVNRGVGRGVAQVEGSAKDFAGFEFGGGRWRLTFPQSKLKAVGRVVVRPGVGGGGGFEVAYERCVEADRVPMQPRSWQRVEWAVRRSGAVAPGVTLEPGHRVERSHGGKLDGALDELRMPSALRDLLRYHREAVKAMAVIGHDWGNVTGFNAGTPSGGVHGMNRLNHNAAIFEDGLRSGDGRLRETALLWCWNFADLSIWWPAFRDATQLRRDSREGGTRYNNVTGQGRTPLTTDYMWRSNDAVNFCTKGYDSFLDAYWETGDPLFLEALRVQVEYAREHVHANRGECRNVGDVRDFVRLYEKTGERVYLEEALRLFRELREKVSAGGLFDQGGKPLEPDPPFIETDATGLKVGYAKPYIIGYALAGLPALARHVPDEPRLKEVIRAVADFMALSLDPVGGWRYPHPASSSVILSQAMEHAWQLVQADEYLGPVETHLDAIEAVLRQRILGWLKTGKILSGLGGWELATGRVKAAAEIEGLYARPGDRDRARDYLEGAVGVGSAPPEGVVYFPEVLAFYSRHRSVARLIEPPDAKSPLGQVLGRVR